MLRAGRGRLRRGLLGALVHYSLAGRKGSLNSIFIFRTPRTSTYRILMFPSKENVPQGPKSTVSMVTKRLFNEKL